MKHLMVLAYFLCLETLVLSQPVNSESILPPPVNGDMYVIAHRGYHNGIPENSLPAYQKAIDLGCDFIEVDLRTTKDGAIVSIHNATIDAYVEDQSGKVSDLTLAELKSLDIGKKIDERWKNTRIPTFDEILELCSGKIGIYLDLKNADPDILISMLKEYKMQQNTVWYIPASYHKTIMDIKRSCPECIVMPDPGEAQNIETVVTAYNPKVIATDMDHLSKQFVEAAHQNGILVFTDDDEDDPMKREREWEKIADWQTDGIQTDHPEELIKYLKNKP